MDAVTCLHVAALASRTGLVLVTVTPAGAPPVTAPVHPTQAIAMAMDLYRAAVAASEWSTGRDSLYNELRAELAVPALASDTTPQP